jgi:hypothetical protein
MNHATPVGELKFSGVFVAVTAQNNRSTWGIDNGLFDLLRNTTRFPGSRLLSRFIKRL